MGGDYSKRSFDPTKHYGSVFRQQGRVQMDSDFNEDVEIQDRRFRTALLDLIGVSGVPTQDGDNGDSASGFKLSWGENGLVVGRGRIYVDGFDGREQPG